MALARESPGPAALLAAASVLLLWALSRAGLGTFPRGEMLPQPPPHITHLPLKLHTPSPVLILPFFYLQHPSVQMLFFAHKKGCYLLGGLAFKQGSNPRARG